MGTYICDVFPAEDTTPKRSPPSVCLGFGGGVLNSWMDIATLELLRIGCAIGRGVEATLSLAPSSRKFSNVEKEFRRGGWSDPKTQGPRFGGRSMPCEVGLLCDTIMRPRGLKALRKSRRGIGPCEAWYLHRRRPNKRIRRGGWNNPKTRGPHFGGRDMTSEVGVLCHAITIARGR